MSNITTHNALWQHLRGAQVVQGTYSLIDWIILAYGGGGGVLAQWGEPPWTHRSLEIYWEADKRQWDKRSTSLSLKVLIWPHSLKEWKPFCPSTCMECWYPCWVQPWDKLFLMLGNPLLIWRKLINPWERYGQWERSKMKRKLRKPKGSPTGCKNKSVKITWKQMYFDLIAVRTPLNQIDQQPNTVLTGPWKALKIWTIVHTCPIGSYHPCCPACSGIISIWSGCFPCPEGKMQSELPPCEGNWR